MKARKLFASLLTAAMLTCTTSAAFACVHGMEMDVNDEETESIYTAEDAFYDGDYRKTVGHLLKIKPDMRKRTSKYTKAAGEDKRAYLMLAAAVVRLEGNVMLHSAAGTSIKSSKTRASNLAWATDVLEHAHKSDKDDIEATAYLAEAYAANPKTHDKAKTLLTGLAKDDLMADATGWSVFAKLQHADGDVDGAKASSKRCTEIARDASMCKLPALEEAKATEADVEVKAKTAAKKS